MSYCVVNRSCINFKNYKNCQLYKIFHKIVKSFKKLGLGTPPLKKREKKLFLLLQALMYNTVIAQQEQLATSALCEEFSCVPRTVKFSDIVFICSSLFICCK